MRKGYKDTPIGIIPEDWEVVKLGALGTTYNGLSGKTKEDFGVGEPFIPYKNIFNNSRIDSEYFDYVQINPDENQNPVKYGDIFFTTSSETAEEVGMSSVLLTHIRGTYLNSFCFGFRLNDFNKVIPEYARYVLRGEETRKTLTILAQGYTRYNLSKSIVLEKLLLKLPPVHEQSKIAFILSTVDDKIDTINEKITQTQQLKNGLMQRLLTRGIGHTKFKDSPLGEIPESWSTIKLGEVIKKIISGVSVNSEDRHISEGEVGILKTSALSKGKFDPTQHKLIIPSEINRAKLNPKYDTILISRMNTPALVGESGYVDKDYLNLFIPDRIWMTETVDIKKVYVKWLSYVIASPVMKEMLSLIATGTSNSMKNISIPSFLGLMITLPSIEEQKEIATILSIIDWKLDILHEKKSTYNQFKKGLMQQLLTGNIRLNLNPST